MASGKKIAAGTDFVKMAGTRGLIGGSALDEGQRKELRDLLVELDSRKELDRMGERERLIERNRHAYEFQDLKQRIILPIMREFMAKLESKGHLTRLRETDHGKVRFDVQLQSTAAKRGAIELVLHSEPDKVRVDYAWGWKLEQEIYPLAKVDAKLVTERVLHLLRGLI